MPAAISFFDMAVSITAPNGYLEPQPILLGANWQSNDIRLVFISASGTEPTPDGSQDVTLMLGMTPDPPTSFSSAYTLDPGLETQGVYYSLLATGDTDTSVAWTKPPGWRHFVLGTLTARGASPTAAPVAGALTVSYTVGDANAVISSVSVPAAGTMVFCIGTIPDPEGTWPSWAVSMGVPTGWTHLTATEKSGTNFFPYDANPNLMVVAKSFASSGSTGSVSVPVALGGPAFSAMYAFVQPAPDVSVSVGAA